MGLRDGDLIKKIDETEFDKFSVGTLKNSIMINGAKKN